ncbi:hypothetical protein SAMN04487870_1153 [Pseudoalteromonas sp. DSM 26666]|uniref:hypothetical protein n=1 Tax=Pseudoalteromonas sp. DSM 26666 TaxID=1761892 RepID=UPI0008E18E9D|nr:hypothetical protein [Pseudoalteromonas sp. DSM 26666]SFT63088.1 hypothetical protein SAMN04487870_1153 [Pseudoalteromonas sp. DSM 26666]
MVAKLNLPNNCSLDILREIIVERREHRPLQAFYDDIKPSLELQFSEYVSKKGDPAFIKPLDLSQFTIDKIESEKRKKTLINLFKPKNHQLPYLILDMMRNDHGLLCCPSCGEDGSPGTLDHYLPKDIFPELSICLANLTPMCNHCQKAKLTAYMTEEGDKAYFHPYFDEINDSFFRVIIEEPFNAPSFKLQISNAPKDIEGLLELHSKGINLKERFHKFCKTKHIHLMKLIAKKRRNKQLQSAKELIENYIEPELEKSLNSWPAIYYQSVLDAPAFLDYLDNGKLPDNI